MMPEQQQRILGYFIEEAKDHLNTIEQGLLNLQATIQDPEMVSEVFRAAHSVKGGAAMLSLGSIQQTSHRLEDYFKVLKEAPTTQIDRDLESMFLQVFDGLQALLEELQGPFGLTDEKAQEIMADVEPVFERLESHLNELVAAAPETAPAVAPAVTARSARPARVVTTSSEDSALKLVFSSDVPGHLREMLTLFKQADSESSRSALQSTCEALKRVGEQFDLSHWCDLAAAARQAIGNPEQTYRSLAPVVIKELKRSQELVLSGQASEIAISSDLEALMPPPESTDAAIDDIDALLGDALTSPDAEEPDFDALFESETQPVSDAATDIDWLTAAETNAETPAEKPADSLDLIDSFDALTATPGAEVPREPTVGAAELNSLADLFEGEVSELDSPWEEISEGEAAIAETQSPDLDIDSDFSDLLEASLQEETTDNSDDLADLFGNTNDLAEVSAPSKAVPSSETTSENGFEDLMEITDEAASGAAEDSLRVDDAGVDSLLDDLTAAPDEVNEAEASDDLEFDLTDASEEVTDNLEFTAETLPDNLSSDDEGFGDLFSDDAAGAAAPATDDVTPELENSSPDNDGDFGNLFEDDATGAAALATDDLTATLANSPSEDEDGEFGDLFGDDAAVTDAPATDGLAADFENLSGGADEDFGDLFGDDEVVATAGPDELAATLGNTLTDETEVAVDADAISPEAAGSGAAIDTDAAESFDEIKDPWSSDEPEIAVSDESALEALDDLWTEQDPAASTTGISEASNDLDFSDFPDLDETDHSTESIADSAPVDDDFLTDDGLVSAGAADSFEADGTEDEAGAMANPSAEDSGTLLSTEEVEDSSAAIADDGLGVLFDDEIKAVEDDATALSSVDDATSDLLDLMEESAPSAAPTVQADEFAEFDTEATATDARFDEPLDMADGAELDDGLGLTFADSSDEDLTLGADEELDFLAATEEPTASANDELGSLFDEPTSVEFDTAAEELAAPADELFDTAEAAPSETIAIDDSSDDFFGGESTEEDLDLETPTSDIDDFFGTSEVSDDLLPEAIADELDATPAANDDLFTNELDANPLVDTAADADNLLSLVDPGSEDAFFAAPSADSEDGDAGGLLEADGLSADDAGATPEEITAEVGDQDAGSLAEMSSAEGDFGDLEVAELDASLTGDDELPATDLLVDSDSPDLELDALNDLDLSAAASEDRDNILTTPDAGLSELTDLEALGIDADVDDPGPSGDSAPAAATQDFDLGSDGGFGELDAMLEEPAAIAPTESDTGVSAADGEFDELDDLLNDAPSEATEVSTATDDNVDFGELDALLDDGPATDEAEPANAFDGGDDGFGDLEKLLEEADQTLGGSASTIRSPGAGRSSRRVGGIVDQTMRVSVKHLDNLNNLVGELVVNRNSLEQDQDRFRQFLDNLLFQVQQLNDVGQRMRDLYERSLLESSLLASRQSFQAGGTQVVQIAGNGDGHATGADFDALEMDRFTGFHTLTQEMIELIVRVRESSSDIAYTVESTDQIARQFRQVTTQLQEGLNKARMVPFAQTADRLPRAVRDISIKCGKEARLVVEGRDTLIDKMLLERLYDPMTHLVNNAITHGIESPEERAAVGKSREGKITVRAFYQGNQTVIYIEDDGAGINPDVVKSKAIQKGLITQAEADSMNTLEIYELLFRHGFSTRDQADDFAGRGVGMDVVRTALSEIRGSISIDSEMGKGTSFTIRLPLTLSISKALSCLNNQARIAFPMDGVEDMFDVPRERIQAKDDGQTFIQWRDMSLSFQPLSDLLQFNRALGRGRVYGGSQDDDMVSIVVLRNANTYIGIQVDRVLGEQEIVIKQIEGPVPKPMGIAGATVLGDGRVMPIGDVLELIDIAQGRVRREAGSSLWSQVELPPEEEEVVKTEPTVLIVDDSITVRELLSMSFNKVGYRVEQARDGQEAWEKMRSGLPCDLVFCDIEMPRMDGLELLSRMQKDSMLKQVPIAMLTSRGADRHRQMAVDLGASGYFTKPYLEEALLDAAQKMLQGEVLIDQMADESE
ncbi:MAG: response regulator [Leptolyngbyaceae cyanobacterium]